MSTAHALAAIVAVVCSVTLVSSLEAEPPPSAALTLASFYGGTHDEQRGQAAEAEPDAETDSVRSGEDFLSKSEHEMLDLVNRERSKTKLPPLKASRQLTVAARAHAANMARQRTLEHTLDGKTFDQRIDAAGYKFSAAGENIYMGPSAAHAITTWMRSPGHRRNMLSPTYEEIGIGMALGPSKHEYWTQVFATPLPSASARRAPTAP